MGFLAGLHDECRVPHIKHEELERALGLGQDESVIREPMREPGEALTHEELPPSWIDDLNYVVNRCVNLSGGSLPVSCTSTNYCHLVSGWCTICYHTPDRPEYGSYVNWCPEL